jgi:4-hydroxybenzoate polyprenyltransferase
MLALQASIGALNDLVDAGVDRGRKPGKPIPRGVVGPTAAGLLAAAGLAVGLALSAVSGIPTLLVAAAGVGCGYLYDLRLSRSAWSWLPLALALPLVPFHAWLGATGSAPTALLALVPVAVLGGSGLALGNGLVDVERDRAAGMTTAVVALGHRRAWLLHAVALAGAVGAAIVLEPGGGPATAAWRVAAHVVAVASIAVGAALLGRGRPPTRERGWELEAAGVAVLGIAWLAGLAPG